MHSTNKQAPTCEQIILTSKGPKQNKFEANNNCKIVHVNYVTAHYLHQPHHE